MWFAIFKALLSGVIIMAISEIGKRSSAFAALVASLPLISVMGMVWLWGETGDRSRLADHAEATFWYVLPSLPMFLLLPALLRSGVNFWLALALSCLLTTLLYLIMVWVLPRFGIRF
ncbi:MULTISPECIES: DUF3147 family protein [Limibacillus]|jgi:hypothetical protein|uniref:DUF3147 family protein n=1 Tax=Limibacillus halophilus TaxID=1579333 RepID=A0A839SVM3_9PROT|nr:DUF3147 family protein [Limibacillus halophilus]MBB3064993.1 hypothetical protein [Limibacillus halophilus]